MKPHTDPRITLESRVHELKEQAEKLAAPDEVKNAVSQLETTATKFREGEITAEQVCKDAVETYWGTQKFQRPGDIPHLLATLGVDFSADASIDFQKYWSLWESAEKRATLN